MMKKFWIGLLIGIGSLFLIGALDFDEEYNLTIYGDFSGGKNEFSSPANVKDNQALNLSNLLFYGSQLRARKGISDLNRTGFGNLEFSDTVDIDASIGDCNYDDDTFNSDSINYSLANQSHPDFTAGIRFSSVDISRRAIIDSAFLKLSTFSGCAGGRCKTIIYGSDEDDAVIFSESNTPADRTKTDASVTYQTIGDNTPNGEFFITLTVTDIVQEIVDRSGWDEGSDLAFLIEDNGTTGAGENIKWYTYDHPSATIPNLKIFYSEIATKGITGVKEYRKSGGFSQILAVSNGMIWFYDDDTDKFMDFLQFTVDTVGSVIVVSDDSTIYGLQTSYTNLGYADSIPIYLNDSLHYIYQIACDTLIYLYDQFKGSLDSTASLTKAVFIPRDKPALFDTWLDYEFIPGLTQLIKYDGSPIDIDEDDTLEFEIDSITHDHQRLNIWTNPQFDSAGYEYYQLNNSYVIGYNDTVSDPRLNIPLLIVSQHGEYLTTWVDTTWDSTHLYEGQTFKILPPLEAEYRVYAGVVDSLDTVWAGTDAMQCKLYDNSQTWTKYDMNFGYFYIINDEIENPPGSRPPAHSLCHLLEDGNSDVYLEIFITDWAVAYLEPEDTFEVWRKVDSYREHVPQYVTHWQDRQWRAGYTDDPNLLRYSYSFDPDSFPALYFMYVNPDDGDVLTAIVPLSFQDVLLVFKTKHIYGVTTGGWDEWDWSIIDLVDGIGTPTWSSIISYGQAIYFYDYTGFYRYDLSGMPQKISWQIEKTVADSINKDYAHLIVGGHFDQHLWWSYPSGSAIKNNRTILYNLEDNAWTTVDVIASAYFVGQIETDSNGVLIGDPDSGKVYRYGMSYFDNDESIDAIYESPWLDVGDEYDFIKDFKDIQFVFDKHDSTIIYFDYYKDYVDSVIWTDTIGIDDVDILAYHRRAIQGDMLGQRIKLKIRVLRIDDTFQLPFYCLRWEAVGEVLYDED